MSEYVANEAIAEARKAQRKGGIRGRDGLGKEVRAEYSRRIVERIVESEAFKKAEIIFSYRAVKGEVSLELLEEKAAALGKRIAYPLCIGPGQMIALIPAADGGWVPGAFNILEPCRETAEEIPPEKLDLLLCPCSSFDEECNRMGMGGGYYDRYLPRCVNAVITAVAFEAQKSDKIAMEPWDEPVQGVFTEERTYGNI